MISRDEIIQAAGSDLAAVPASALPPDVDAAAAAEIEADRIQDRLDVFLGRRPADFAASGDLDSRLAAWLDALMRGEAGNLVIHGNVGTGKTWAAWRTGEELLRRGYRGRIEIVSAYRLKRLFAPPTDYAEIDRLTGTDLLALDDIGAVRVSDWDADLLGGLIDERSAAQMPTVIIANPPSEPLAEGQTLLQALLGDRVASRIARGVTVVALTGSDRRRSA